MKFEALGIQAEILKALADEGYESPTPIQEQTIPATLSGRDVLGLAQTGTGKTAAFAVPTLQLLAKKPQGDKKRKIRAIILTPTRELGTQIYESFVSYGRYLPLKSTVIFGGVGQGKQVSALRSGIDILVATPGRLADLINQGFIDLSGIEIFILDEADRMLDMGFIHDIRRLVKILPKKKQTLFFSATMPKEIVEIVDHLLVDPVQVSVAPVSSTVDTVKQTVQYVDQEHKIDLFVQFLKEHKNEPVLVFTRTKRGADRVVKDLAARNIKAQAIHGNKSQNARQNALENFKSFETQVLVATDIAARGIDINELGLVVNFDLPEVPETYVHRIGRTGRAGHTGSALSYVNFKDIALLKDIEKLIKIKIEVLPNEEFPLVDKTIPVKEKQRQKPQRSQNNKRRAPSKAVVKEDQAVRKSDHKKLVIKKVEGDVRKERSRRPIKKAGGHPSTDKESKRFDDRKSSKEGFGSSRGSSDKKSYSKDSDRKSYGNKDGNKSNYRGKSSSKSQPAGSVRYSNKKK